MASTDAFVAATRFGLGARPGELATVASGPREWLRAQLDRGDPEVETRLAALAPGTAGVQAMMAMRGASEGERQAMKAERKDAFKEEQSQLLAAAAASATPFRERLVAFWSNHFTVSITQDEVAGVAGAYEREVVRANLDGTFEDMLVASTRHPAMLVYLDNFRSVGPGSPAGRRSGKGLNENLAREVLELHTLGVDGGYDQGDVEAFARLLTGWSIDVGEPGARSASGPRPPGDGTFTFYAQRHEPGAVTLLGRGYAKGTEADGLDALRALALHPSTARHLATKLARAFVADAPPPSAVGRLEQAFRSSGGHLPTVHRALVELDEAWAEPLPKLKTPWDLVQSTSRMLEPATAPDGMRLLKSLHFLGQLPYQAPSPQGWPDEALAWTGPEAILARLEWAEEVARRLPLADAPALAESVLGPVLTPRTARAMEGSGGRSALATLIGCPEFQRR